MSSSCLQDEKQIEWQLKRREELLRNKQVPTQSDLFKSLGEPLGRIILDTMNPLSKGLICSAKSQTDKVCPVQVAHSEITKACVHQGILEIGKQMEEKLEEAYKKLIRNAFNESRDFERFQCERRINFLLNYEREKHQSDVNKIIKECNDALETERNALSEKMICMQNNSIKKEEKGVQTAHSIESKMKPTINETLPKMNSKLNPSFQRLYKDFKDHLCTYRHLLTCSNIPGKFCSDQIIYRMLKNVKESLEHTSINDSEKDFLLHLRTEIEREIKFNKNLCDCNKQHQHETPFSRKLTGAIVYPKTYGDTIYCNCHSSTQDSDEEFLQKYAKYQVTTNDELNIEWSTVSENPFRKIESFCSSSSTDNESVLGDVPLRSDIAMAKKIVSLANVDQILKAAFQKMLPNVSAKLHHEIGEYIKAEFSYIFNEETVLKTIEEMTNRRKQSFILGAADSLELLRAKKSTKFDISNTEAQYHIQLGPVKLHSFCSIAEKISSYGSTNGDKHLSTLKIEQEKLNSPIEITKNIQNLQKGDANQFSQWLYRECTDEEWKALLQDICQRMTMLERR